MLFAVFWWIIDAHKWFKGPKVNVEHRMLGDTGDVIEGKGSITPESASLSGRNRGNDLKV